MNEQDAKALLKEGAEYVQEYFREGRNKHIDIELIEGIIDIYHDYLLLVNAFEVKE